MKKIGIITQYYNSSNFGGLLQAYALCRYLETAGYAPRQIMYNQYLKNTDLTKRKGSRNKYLAYVIKKYNNLLIKMNNKVHGVSNLRAQRRNACKEFRDSIPHTDRLYDESNISECVNDFDVFITGSDQVWRPSMFCPAFFLDFVDGSVKPKVSYAASVNSELTDPNIRDVYAEKLKDFTIISVREKRDVKSIQSLTKIPVHWALDPVFLLDQNQWSEIVQGSGCKAPFVFCYFLGDGMKERVIAEQYARKHGLKLVTIPYMHMNYRKCDRGFGDLRLVDVSPNLFLSLIRESQFVFTDSFHASAFSIIFDKPFVVFGRDDHPEMSERIVSLTSLFHCEERYCSKDGNKNLAYVEALDNKHTKYQSSEYDLLLSESKRMLDL